MLPSSLTTLSHSKFRQRRHNRRRVPQGARCIRRVRPNSLGVSRKSREGQWLTCCLAASPSASLQPSVRGPPDSVAFRNVAEFGFFGIGIASAVAPARGTITRRQRHPSPPVIACSKGHQRLAPCVRRICEPDEMIVKTKQCTRCSRRADPSTAISAISPLLFNLNATGIRFAGPQRKRIGVFCKSVKFARS